MERNSENNLRINLIIATHLLNTVSDVFFHSLIFSVLKIEQRASSRQFSGIKYTRVVAQPSLLSISITFVFKDGILLCCPG